VIRFFAFVKDVAASREPDVRGAADEQSHVFGPKAVEEGMLRENRFKSLHRDFLLV